MAKVTLDLVGEVLKNNDLGDEKVTAILRQLVRAAEKEAAEAESSAEPAGKKQFVILLAPAASDTDITAAEEDRVGWVLQIPEEANPSTAVENVIKAAHMFNATRRGRKQPAKTFGEACEVVGARWFKNLLTSVKTRLPVIAITVSNELPAPSVEDIQL